MLIGNLSLWFLVTIFLALLFVMIYMLFDYVLLKHKSIGDVILMLILLFIGSAVILGIVLCGAFFTEYDETLEQNVIISNDTLRAISSSNSATSYMNGGLFVINGYSEDKPVYKYYYLTENLSYKQNSIPVEKTDIMIHNSSVSYVIHYGDRVETVYFGGLLHDPETIRYENEHYTIYIPENGLSDEIYIN